MEVAEWIAIDLDELSHCLHQALPAGGEGLVAAICGADRAFLMGVGRTGLVMRMFALRLMQLGVETFVVGDATTPAIGPGDLLIAGSASGTTQGVLLKVRQARAAGARVAAITADGQSELAGLAEIVTVVPGDTPKLPNRSTTSQLPLATVLEQAFLVVTDCLIARLAERTAQTEETMMARHANLE